jgi:hypothetical protein
MGPTTKGIDDIIDVRPAFLRCQESKMKTPVIRTPMARVRLAAAAHRKARIQFN